MGASSLTERVRACINPKPDYTRKPIGLSWRSNTIYIIATVGIGLFTDLFLYGLVVPILPFLLKDRTGISDDQIQSNVSGLLVAYAAASVVFSPLAGFIADKTSSRQVPYVGGLSALIAATIMFFLGQSLPVLIVARILQGASSAFVWTVGLALCIDTVGPENLGKTIGSIFSFISVGELFAPVLGGVLYDKSGTGGTLALALGVLVVDLVMRLLVIEKKVAARYEAYDQSTDDADNTPDRTDHDEQQSDAADEESPLLANGQKDEDEDDAFLVPEGQPAFICKVPVLYCLTSPSLIMAQITALVQAIIIASFDATVTTHAQDLYGFSSFQASLLFVPLSIMNLICGPIGGWCVDKFGTKPVAVFGFGYLVPILVLLRIPTDSPLPKEIIIYGVFMGLAGVGMAVIGSPSIVEAGAVVDKFHKRNPEFFGEQGPYAQLYAINSMVFCLGLSVGPVLGGQLKDAIGYGNMNAVIAAISGVTAIASFIWLGGKPTKRSSVKKAKRVFGRRAVAVVTGKDEP